MNTFNKDNPDAYTGLGVLSTGGFIGGVKTVDPQRFGLRMNDSGGLAGIGVGIADTSIVSDKVVNGKPAWELSKNGTINVQVTSEEKLESEGNFDLHDYISKQISNTNLGVSRPFGGFHLGAVCNDPIETPPWAFDKDGSFTLNANVVDESTVRQAELGVYRPKLEDRKVGKVGMHMVIDGFPRALREVAKVMTWAADVKGYKLHDWRNLPNPEIDFPAAEYRHQNDNSIMKAEGTSAIERTDHESNLLHAAHKVFNGLAELELVLAGVIK